MGFEPPTSSSESRVLPLYHKAPNWSTNVNDSHFSPSLILACKASSYHILKDNGLAHKYWTRMDVSESYKNTSLLSNRIYYNCGKFVGHRSVLRRLFYLNSRLCRWYLMSKACIFSLVIIPSKVKVGFKFQNTLPYYDMELILVVENFISLRLQCYMNYFLPCLKPLLFG